MSFSLFGHGHKDKDSQPVAAPPVAPRDFVDPVGDQPKWAEADGLTANNIEEGRKFSVVQRAEAIKAGEAVLKASDPEEAAKWEQFAAPDSSTTAQYGSAVQEQRTEQPAQMPDSNGPTPTAA